MKKSISVIAVVLVLACLVGVFAACSSNGGISFKRAKIKIDHTAPAVLTTANLAEVTPLLGTMNQNTSPNDVLLLTGRQTEQATLFSLYNVETGAMLATDTTDTFTLYAYGDNAFYLRSTLNPATNKYATTLYNAKGDAMKFIDETGAEQEAYVSDGIPAVQNVTMDVFSFADNYFRMDDDSYAISRIRRMPVLSDFAYNFTDSGDKYYYQISVGQRRALIFDKNLDLVTSYYVHGSFNNLSIFVLQDGDLLVQTTTNLMAEEKTYTYIQNGVKVLLKTYVVDAKKGTATEKKFDYLVQNLVAVSEDDDVLVNADNVAVLAPIENERLLNNANDVMCVSLTDSLTIKGRFDQMIDNQTPGNFPDSINGYLILRTPMGRKLVTTDGKVIGDFSYQNYNETLFSKGGKLYSFDLKMVLDYTKEGYVIESWMNRSVILSKNTTAGKVYYRINAEMSEPKAISAANDPVYVLSDYFYAVRTATATGFSYAYYNENDEVLTGIPTDSLASVVASNGDKDFVLLSSTVAGVKHYYRLSK